MSRKILEEMANLLDRLDLAESQIAALNKRAAESDKHMQILITAVERLCDTAGAKTPGIELPFEAELNDALSKPGK
jgi:hypothetical protein